jgi:glycine hydroxymethyltransferase
MHYSLEDLMTFDPDIAGVFRNELKRQEEQIELIASENYASKRVLMAQGSVLTNKYAATLLKGTMEAVSMLM